MQINADRWIRGTAMFSVVTVSGIAAVVSYTHIQHVSITHGQTRLDAALLPVSVDGLILCASMTAFYASRRRLAVPTLARFALGLAISATIAANCLFGISHGWLGAVLSAWPAVAFIFAMELTIWVVRTAAGARTSRRASARASDARLWARNQGYDVADRGRLPDDVARAYAANGKITDDASTVVNNHSREPGKEIVIIGSEQA